MCDLIDLKVVDLFRTRIGPLDLGDSPKAAKGDPRSSLMALSRSGR